VSSDSLSKSGFFELVSCWAASLYSPIIAQAFRPMDDTKFRLEGAGWPVGMRLVNLRLSRIAEKPQERILRYQAETSPVIDWRHS
jgi:hypothetical protein